MNDSYKPPTWLHLFGHLGRKVYNIFNQPYKALGYVNDWKEAFIKSDKLDVDLYNICDLVAYKNCKKKINEYSVLIVLHSALGDNCELLLKTAHWFQKRKGKLVVFIGNEYDLLDKKIQFLKEAGADFICSQLPRSASQFLYADCEHSTIVDMPHALNEEVYQHSPKKNYETKVSFIGARYPIWLGDDERNDFIDYCKSLNSSSFVIKDCEGNLPRSDWASFLVNASATIGAEAGTYFLDRHGEILSAAKKAHEQGHGEVFFSHQEYAENNNIEYTSGKAISSRHFEAMGTKTVQILLEGEYNHLMTPDLHYISIKKDFSNFKEKWQEFEDQSRCTDISERCFEYVMEKHRYVHRVDHLLSTLGVC